jgi:hypothetical protein
LKGICSELHRIINTLPRYHFPLNDKHIPKNGIYIIFEKGEVGHKSDRIVRVGTHTGANQLRSRLKQHFIKENKDRSIFRKNIGRCFLNQKQDLYLHIWELDCTTSKNKAMYGHLIQPQYQQSIEAKISEYIQSAFTFSILQVETKEERLHLESRIVSTVASCNHCSPSSEWLGHASPKEKIRDSGLWQVNELYKEPLDEYDLNKLAGMLL